MATNRVNVRRKEFSKPRFDFQRLIIPSVGLLLFAAIVFLAFGYFAKGFGFFGGAGNESTPDSDGNSVVIRVPPGGDLQAAVDKARGGDIIELQAGATYNEITLPAKDISEFITIRTSAIDRLPEDIRVSPSQSSQMAKIITRGGGKPAVETKNGAHHFRFVGVEFAPSNADYIYNLVYLAASTDSVADVPHDLEFDRCYFHSISEGVARRGLALNSANTIVKNSYFEGFAFKGEESQGICGWTGTKNVKIINNYIEGGAENVMFGGSDPANAELIPQDIEVRGNNFYKPAEWKGRTMKNLFEIKNAKRVQFVGNYLVNSWDGAALTITVRNQEGSAKFSTIEDVLIQDNIINNAGEGVNILGKDDTYPSQTMKNLKIINNLFLDIGNKSFQGRGYFIQINGGSDILVANNTVFNYGNIVSMHGDLPVNFIFRDNIVGHNEYGIHGHPAVKSSDGQKTFLNNVIVNNKNVTPSDVSFPSNNFWVSDYESVGFVNYTQNNFSLSPNSRFKGKGADNSDIGCDPKSLPFELSKWLLK